MPIFVCINLSWKAVNVAKVSKLNITESACCPVIIDEDVVGFDVWSLVRDAGMMRSKTVIN